jgi:CRISPR-associated protein Cmr6
MPIYATTAAKEFWEKSLKPATRARSLAAAKFVTIAESKNDKTWRKLSCEAIAKGSTLPAKADSFAQFATTLLAQGAAILHAKLEARLIIDAGGGVIENGGICLDRTSGIPFIPGSAVKGCARRFAIHLLSEENDPAAKAELLAKIAITYGYGDQDWKAGRQKESIRSDFWLAMVPLFDAGPESDVKRDDLWPTVSEQSAKLIFEHLGRTPKEPAMPLAPQLPNLSGMIAFLPAYPEIDPGIEIDVLTPHHPKYYSGDKPIATDDEDPNPVLFPTVAPNAIFRFPLVPLTQGVWSSCPQLFSPSTPLEFARTCLAESLQLFGLGAKTNAGYGWFDASSELNEQIHRETKRQTTVIQLIAAHHGFETWDESRKEDAILALADQKENCLAWYQNSPSTFKPLRDFAETISLPLV